jgi:hypothetical protein
MKKIFDSFLTNALIVALVVLYMIYDEQCICPGHPLTEDLTYGIFVSFAASFLAETIKVLGCQRNYKWWHFIIGAVTGFVLAFGIGYLIYGTL